MVTWVAVGVRGQFAGTGRVEVIGGDVSPRSQPAQPGQGGAGLGAGADKAEGVAIRIGESVRGQRGGQAGAPVGEDGRVGQGEQFSGAQVV